MRVFTDERIDFNVKARMIIRASSYAKEGVGAQRNHSGSLHEREWVWEVRGLKRDLKFRVKMTIMCWRHVLLARPVSSDAVRFF